MSVFSPMAQSLWAKKSKDGNDQWLPLTVHMTDAASTAKKLWNHWVSDGVKKSINSGLQNGACGEQLLIFLAAAHDLGKATPVFQAKRSNSNELDRVIFERTQSSGLVMQNTADFQSASKTPHALATQVLLRQQGCDRRIAATLGAHHGRPSDTDDGYDQVTQYPENYHMGRAGKVAWEAVQQEVCGFALSLAGYKTMADLPQPSMPVQVLLSGLVILVDWIASSEEFFPYLTVDSIVMPCPKNRIKVAWQKLSLPHSWHASNKWMNSDLFVERFGFAANALQRAVIEVAKGVENPGLLVLEAPMGVGKTEAALLAAEIYAAKSRRKGVFFALPTQSTSDGIFPRFLAWLRQATGNETSSLRLMHGKAQFNATYEGLTRIAPNEDEESRVIVHQWFAGRKKGLLDDFGVGTVDHVLMSALKQKHVMLRHLGLANKVVIIDECHAYDAYMSQYLFMALRWFGAYQVPVIVLSATLPAKQRQALVEAYLDERPAQQRQTDPLGKRTSVPTRAPARVTSQEYPLVTYTDKGEVYHTPLPHDGLPNTVQVEHISEEELTDKLRDLLSDGGCVGIIVNTVGRAQQLAASLRDSFSPARVRILHSRFLAPDRSRLEQELLGELGKETQGVTRPAERIVIGTQVLEQSLDIDFDLLVTDLCPMDLLLQRIGRLHRHHRSRPPKLAQAKCFILGAGEEGVFEKGSAAVYGQYLLLRTQACLPKQISLPDDISRLVQEVYREDEPALPYNPAYGKALAEHKSFIASQEKRAKNFRLTPPWPDGNLIGWLQTPASDRNEKSGEAAVRDGDESIEVILVQKKTDGRFHFLPWLEGGQSISHDSPPGFEMGRALARCRVRLPPVICSVRNIDKAIKELEVLSAAELREWQRSPWLAGELFLILDSDFSATLCGYKLTYDQNMGLIQRKEE